MITVTLHSAYVDKSYVIPIMDKAENLYVHEWEEKQIVLITLKAN